MNKDRLLKDLQKATRGNFFSIEIPTASKNDENIIREMVNELEKEGKIKLRECIPREYSFYLHGIIKYSSE
ncbi:hypothetical protein RCG23_02085 [Neobacillus sp. PS3-34]|uniref:hypothetical protein n=1 Tax=Neobacillus sp. PS3-34 TaxID=3070678 RepID=UPI0027DF6AC6|nr:hypothetical protein [Neobacillus sp. PS3-34]WML48929.1 hypothetical protein RCG23_02085 [Neobacillus sp. PS3-34]